MTRKQYFFMKKQQFFFAICCIFSTLHVHAQINHDPTTKSVHINTSDQKLSLHIDYASGVNVSNLEINGKSVLSSTGAFTAVRTSETHWTSLDNQQVNVSIKANKVILEGIKLGNIQESWQFTLQGSKILWTIKRSYPNDINAEDMAFPSWHFADMKTWKGGILDNGGMVWCKYLGYVNDTYGVHTGGVTFWNEDEKDALRISAQHADDRHIAAKYSHNDQGAFTFTHLLAAEELKQRHHLSRFVHRKEDVFAPFVIKKGKEQVTFTLEYIDYLATYDRGHLPGIDVSAVRELLNTTGRYGVVDNRIIGANGWITNWKCLHEPFFAQVGLALNDKNYTDNLSATLDQERDLAMLEDGRVLSRWHDVPGDEMPGTYNAETGYYEARWGYTVDSQTGYIINTAEQFQQTADLDWLRAHKASCERALDWLIRRDSNRNGIFEMVNKHIKEEKASDWLDIVWASFENAFVNAQMYEGLKLWAECEQILGDTEKANYYASVAEKLKQAFNKPVDEGGFWYPEKKQYIYWRDADGSIHGDNLVTPVNFAAIAYGICDDQERINIILENIENRNVAENLFHWPLCFDSFKREEVSAGNWPFPKYENGDIFPTWGYMGIRSYVKFDKNLALKYVHNILAQYRKDGLSSQRYSRVDQKGLGSDILAGISTTITALYSDIYGVQPKWNRLGIVPHMTAELNGTSFNYTLRDTAYQIALSVDDYKVRTKDFAIRSKRAFGVGRSKDGVIYYPDNKEEVRLEVYAKRNEFVNLEIEHWDSDLFQWRAIDKAPHQYTIHGLKAGTRYQLTTTGGRQELLVDKDGSLTISGKGNSSGQYRLRPTIS